MVNEECLEEREECWGDVVAEICFDFEHRYKPREGERDGVQYLSIYKTTFFADGRYERKGNWGQYQAHLYPKILELVKLMAADN